MKNLFRLIFLLFALLLNGCIDINNCNYNISGKYFCSKDDKAINFIDLNVNGTFLHYYKKGTIILTSRGTWEKSTNGYCYIELSEWKNFNEEGENFKEYGNGILYINDNFLDISPDGNSSSSFRKENEK
ncbi:hypothetical protein SAMN05444377_10368 [Flavobacterium fontis]|uniref:Lipoprotein n=1 Tax=Flavobacterium fontis TaxID=1124188 RepID=A0A1M4YDV8_9FLAO|nr:hypothetical protein [Flavobacterium fontis]SHF04014.1 hypothetical protein SAMN05444377_10368 [Flavobacterium fontis]